MRKQVFLAQGSQEWHDFRAMYIGASEVAAIMGDSPYTSRDNYITEKIRNERKESNFAMQRGTRLEEPSRRLFNAFIGCHAVPAVFINDKMPWLMASLDGFDADKEIIFETKANGKEYHAMALNGKVPKHHLWQLQAILAIMNTQQAYYCSYVDDTDHALIIVNRDDDMIAELLVETKKAHDQIMAFDLPDIEPKEEPIVIESEIWRDHYLALKSLREQIKVLQDQEKAIVAEVKQLADNRPAIGFGMSLKKIITKGKINYEEIPELKGVDFEKYRSPASCYFKVEIEKNADKLESFNLPLS